MKGGVTPLDLDDKVERADAEARAKAIVIATTHYKIQRSSPKSANRCRVR